VCSSDLNLVICIIISDVSKTLKKEVPVPVSARPPTSSLRASLSTAYTYDEYPLTTEQQTRHEQ